MSRSLTAHVLFRLPSPEYDADASQEKRVSESVIPIIEGKIRDAKCRSGEIPSPICYEGPGPNLQPHGLKPRARVKRGESEVQHANGFRVCGQIEAPRYSR
jgi:hypothetical protein